MQTNAHTDSNNTCNHASTRSSDKLEQALLLVKTEPREWWRLEGASRAEKTRCKPTMDRISGCKAHKKTRKVT